MTDIEYGDSEVDQKLKEFNRRHPEVLANARKNANTVSPEPMKNGLGIKLKIDSTEEYERLKEQNSNLKARLGMANEKILENKAEKALDEAEKLGLEFTSITNPQELEYVERQVKNERQKRGLGREIPLSSQQMGWKNNKSVMNQEFSTISDMVTALDAEDTPESRDAVKKILQQTQRTGVSTFEFEGSLKKLKENQNEIRKYKKVR